MAHVVQIDQLTGLIRDIRRHTDLAHAATHDETAAAALMRLLRVSTALSKRWAQSCRREGWWQHARADHTVLQQHITYTDELASLILSAVTLLQPSSPASGEPLSYRHELFEYVSHSGVVVSMWPPIWPSEHIVANPFLQVQLQRFLDWLASSLRSGVHLAQDLVEADIWLFTMCVVRHKIEFDHRIDAEPDLGTIPQAYLRQLFYVAHTALSPAVNNLVHTPNPMLAVTGEDMSASVIILTKLVCVMQMQSRSVRTSCPLIFKLAELVVIVIGTRSRSATCAAIMEECLKLCSRSMIGEAFCSGLVMPRVLSLCVRLYPSLLPLCTDCMGRILENDHLFQSEDVHTYLDLDGLLFGLHVTMVSMKARVTALRPDVFLRELFEAVTGAITSTAQPTVVYDRLRTAQGMPGMTAAWEAIIRWDSPRMDWMEKTSAARHAAHMIRSHAHATSTLPPSSAAAHHQSLRMMSSLSVSVMKMLGEPRTCCTGTDDLSEAVECLLAAFESLTLNGSVNARSCLMMCIQRVYSFISLTHPSLASAVYTAAGTVPMPPEKGDGLCAADPSDTWIMRWLLQDLPSMDGRVLPGCSSRFCLSMSGVSESALKTQLCKGCQRARYCSVTCQRADWAAGGHRLVCGSGFWASTA